MTGLPAMCRMLAFAGSNSVRNQLRTDSEPTRSTSKETLFIRFSSFYLFFLKSFRNGEVLTLANRPRKAVAKPPATLAGAPSMFFWAALPTK